MKSFLDCLKITYQIIIPMVYKIFVNKIWWTEKAKFEMGKNTHAINVKKHKIEVFTRRGRSEGY